jgi:hypothetical protein
VISAIGSLTVGTDTVCTIGSQTHRADIGVNGAALGNPSRLRNVAGSQGRCRECAGSHDGKSDTQNQFVGFYGGVSKSVG